MPFLFWKVSGVFASVSASPHEIFLMMGQIEWLSGFTFISVLS
jgi:hypothetical protein